MKRKKETAFSLIELFTAITVVSILAIIGVYSYSNYQFNARIAALNVNLVTLRNAFEAYHTDWNNYPRPLSPDTPYYDEPWHRGHSDSGNGKISRQLFYPIQYANPEAVLNPVGAQHPTFKRYGFIFHHTADFYRYFMLNPDFNFNTTRYTLHLEFHEAFTDEYMLFGVGPSLDAVLPNSTLSQYIPYDPTNGTRSFGNIMLTRSENPFTLKPIP